jgi:hypothetical protein
LRTQSKKKRKEKENQLTSTDKEMKPLYIASHNIVHWVFIAAVGHTH